MKKTISQKGFTLIELIIVMVILGIMAGEATWISIHILVSSGGNSWITNMPTLLMRWWGAAGGMRGSLE